MAIRLNCPGCGLPMLHQDKEAGMVVPCPRCGHQVMVERGAQGSGEEEARPARKAATEPNFFEGIIATIGVWGICLAVLAGLGAFFYLLYYNFSAPDQMINDGIGTFGAQHLKK